MANFMYETYRPKINVNLASQSELLKELRREIGFVKRRVSRIQKAGYESHAINLLGAHADALQSEWDSKYGIYNTSKRMSKGEIMARMGALRQYLNSQFSTIDAIEKGIAKFSELNNVDGITASKVFERVEDAEQSFKRVMELMDSDIKRRIFGEYVGDDPDKYLEVKYKLANLFEQYGDDYSLQELQETLGNKVDIIGLRS